MVSKNKAYIVANEQQEHEVLDKLYIDGMTWCGGEEATQIIPSDCYFGAFPYVIFVGERLSWNKLPNLEDEEIVFDGRKEEHMSEKYVVSQEFMNELIDWKEHWVVLTLVSDEDITHLPINIYDWWHDYVSEKESNNRLIAIIRWVNGKDVFEVEKPKKWVVRSKGTDDDDNYSYVFINLHNFTLSTYHISNATKFDTKEEAQSWANSHQEVIEVEE